ncbi:MAG: NAD-dependent epimerase/dehydratase family protein, partial [Planctomycetota bacterium]|nr:NAD-dependent epimerase/dehydratase family protein [Planctomycetota bacterium]
AEHKLAGETALAASNISTVSLRYFNVFGPKQDPSSPYSGVISLFIKWATAEQSAKMYGDGLQTRDFVFVDDVVQANLLAAQFARIKQTSEVINIATGHDITICDLWRNLCEICDLKADDIEFMPAREGDIRESVADISRAQLLLNYRANTDLRTGLLKCLEALA